MCILHTRVVSTELITLEYHYSYYQSLSLPLSSNQWLLTQHCTTSIISSSSHFFVSFFFFFPKSFTQFSRVFNTHTEAKSFLHLQMAINDQFPTGLRILVVDDDTSCLFILEKMLLRLMYQGLILYQSSHLFIDCLEKAHIFVPSFCSYHLLTS